MAAVQNNSRELLNKLLPLNPDVNRSMVKNSELEIISNWSFSDHITESTTLIMLSKQIFSLLTNPLLVYRKLDNKMLTPPITKLIEALWI